MDCYYQTNGQKNCKLPNYMKLTKKNYHQSLPDIFDKETHQTNLTFGMGTLLNFHHTCENCNYCNMKRNCNL